MGDRKRVPAWFAEKLDAALAPFLNDDSIRWEREDKVREVILGLAAELVEWMSNCDETDFHQAMEG